MYQKNHQLHKVSQRCSNWPKFSFGFNFSAMASEDIRNTVIGEEEATGTRCSAQNAIGTCQEGSCSFTCQDGFSDCNTDMSDGCEFQLETPTSTCPTD